MMTPDFSSMFQKKNIKKIDNAFLLLIEANKMCGFSQRQDPKELKELRRELNHRLSEEFFSQKGFREKMELIF